MKKFEVTLRQDAVINWVATVEAVNKEDAAAMVLAQWNGEENGVVLLRDGAYGYDNADCEEDDCEEIVDSEAGV